MKTRKSSKNVKRNKKTGSVIKKMRGGASLSIQVKDYTDQDVTEFFLEIKKSLGDNGYFAHSGILSKKFFDIDSSQRHKLQILPKWNNMVNTCFNERGQTPLYSALRFNAENGINAENEMIGMLLEKITNINRPNDLKKTDGSTPLMGLCFGSGQDAVIKWSRVSLLLDTLCKKGSDTTIKNNRGETAFGFLKYKGDNNLIDYT